MKLPFYAKYLFKVFFLVISPWIMNFTSRSSLVHLWKLWYPNNLGKAWAWLCAILPCLVFYPIFLPKSSKQGSSFQYHTFGDLGSVMVPTCSNVPNGCEDDLDGNQHVIDKGKLLYNHPINEFSFKNKHELVNLVSFTREVETHLWTKICYAMPFQHSNYSYIVTLIMVPWMDWNQNC